MLTLLGWWILNAKPKNKKDKHKGKKYKMNLGWQSVYYHLVLSQTILMMKYLMLTALWSICSYNWLVHYKRNVCKTDRIYNFISCLTICFRSSSSTKLNIISNSCGWHLFLLQPFHYCTTQRETGSFLWHQCDTGLLDAVDLKNVACNVFLSGCRHCTTFGIRHNTTNIREPSLSLWYIIWRLYVKTLVV